ncbi:unnamed protein product [Boreogadus saida]
MRVVKVTRNRYLVLVPDAQKRLVGVLKMHFCDLLPLIIGLLSAARDAAAARDTATARDTAVARDAVARDAAARDAAARDAVAAREAAAARDEAAQGNAEALTRRDALGSWTAPPSLSMLR